MVSTKGLVYSASKVSKMLGLPCSNEQRCPRAKKGQLIIYYPGCSLEALRDSRAGESHMWQDNWDDGKERLTAPPGYYVVQVRATG